MLFLESVSPTSVDSYIATGIKSYQQHYLHLWNHGDPSPYISKSFTKKIVGIELNNPNMENFLVKFEDTILGIAKIIRNKEIEEHSAEEALLVEKLYLLNEFSGKGYGSQVLRLVENHARTLGKSVVWLDTMKKGKQLNFYLKNGYEIKKPSEVLLPGVLEEEKAMWVMVKKI